MLLRNILLALYTAVQTTARRRGHACRGHRTCVCLILCLGDRLPVLFRLLTLPWEGVERRLSFGGGLAGRTGTAPGNTVFFLLDGGMRDGGRAEGTGSFSRARYTKCMACEHKRERRSGGEAQGQGGQRAALSGAAVM